MSAAERLAAALAAKGLPLPMLTTTDILAADPHLAEDIETGQRLRERRFSDWLAALDREHTGTSPGGPRLRHVQCTTCALLRVAGADEAWATAAPPPLVPDWVEALG